MRTVAVLGAGSWGTTLANLLAREGHPVRLWAYEQEVVESINARHLNELYLPDSPLDDGLSAFEDPQEAVAGAEAIVAVTPSHAARAVITPLANFIPSGAPVIVATKGIETDTLELMHEVFRDCLPDAKLAVLSGPSFAKEVYQNQPTAVVAASEDERVAGLAQDLFSTSRFRVYTNRDVIGTELGGSLKNVIAIAAGILEGLGLGNNPRAALLTRGLAEITRLGVKMGADPLTFAGLAGVGDLILTATGPLSRNRSLGVALAEGTSLDQYREQHRTVAEGVNTARAAVALGKRLDVELPITAQVAHVLFDGKSPSDTIGDLMERDLKAEHWR
jgi:glycerol-3-phosphate dehydrogenase (NAD(P)+)